MKSLSLETIPGSYGPTVFPESVLHKIWLKQNFLKNGLKTVSGKVLKILDPGKWNLEGPPAFMDALLELDGERIKGNIEMHFQVKGRCDAKSYLDVNSDNTVLEVILYYPFSVDSTIGAFRSDPSGRLLSLESSCSPERLVLLDYLEHDLEGYLMEDALLALQSRDVYRVIAEYLEKSFQSRLSIIQEKSVDRWMRKCALAEKRFSEFGWMEACHQGVMIALGGPSNAIPMLELALSYSLQDMLCKMPEAITLFHEKKEKWTLGGLRPASHPLKRLEQYLFLLRKNPQWARELYERIRVIFEQEKANGSSVIRVKTERSFAWSVSTRIFRKAQKMNALRDILKKDVFCKILSDNKIATFMADCIWPLATIAFEKDFYSCWFHGYGGDVPVMVTEFGKQVGIVDGSKNIVCNGYNQGILKAIWDAFSLT